MGVDGNSDLLRSADFFDTKYSLCLSLRGVFFATVSWVGWQCMKVGETSASFGFARCSVGGQFIGLLLGFHRGLSLFS